MCLNDNGNGVRGTDFVSGFPAGLHAGASWNKDLTYARGYWLGGEFRTKGINVILGPVAAPLGRVAEGGRNWEGMQTDWHSNWNEDAHYLKASAVILTSADHSQLLLFLQCNRTVSLHQ